MAKLDTQDGKIDNLSTKLDAYMTIKSEKLFSRRWIATTVIAVLGGDHRHDERNARDLEASRLPVRPRGRRLPAFFSRGRSGGRVPLHADRRARSSGQARA